MIFMFFTREGAFFAAKGRIFKLSGTKKLF